MRINNRLFPYPVLRKEHDDYSNSLFEASLSFEQSKTEIKLSLSIALNDENLLILLEKNKVRIVCHLECSQTKYRKLHELTLEKTEIIIPAGELNGRLEVVPLIIANEKIENFYSKNFNKDYENHSFKIEEGSILGIADQFKVVIDKEKGDLANIPSIFLIEEKTDINNMRLELIGQKIRVFLPPREYSIYLKLRLNSSFQAILNSMIVFPALISILEQLKDYNASEDYDDYRWYGAIKKRLLVENIDLDSSGLRGVDSLELAQKILELPVSKATSILDKFAEAPE